jgi:predicted phosphodiesterase
MKILVLSDLHLQTHWYAWVASQAANFDVVVLPGDLLDMFAIERRSLQSQAAWVSDWFMRFPRGTALLAVTGNHDYWVGAGPDSEGGWLQHLRRPGVSVDGDSSVFYGHEFLCAPWIGSTRVRTSLPTILISHAPPAGSPVAIGKADGRDFGDFDVRLAALKMRPGSLVLSGHVHAPLCGYAKVGEALALNPGTDLTSAIPNHIVVDLENRTARLSLGGQEVGKVSI